MIKSQRLALLTTSCKWYDDVLDIHEKLFSVHWKDCPYERYLVMDEVTQGADYLNNYDQVIVTGKESEKKNHLRVTEALKRISTPYVIFFQEDMLLYDRVDTERIEHLLDVMERDRHIGALRLLPYYGVQDNNAKEYVNGEDLIKYPKGTPYRVSYAPSIWDRNYLLKLSQKFEYGADFERKGSEMSNKMTKIMLGYKYVAYPYINGILRGKWEIPAVRHLAYYKIIPDFSRHGIMTSKDLLKQGIMGYIYGLNPNFILKVQNKIKIGKSY